MSTNWKYETGHLVCKLSHAGQLSGFHPDWMKDEASGTDLHLTPTPNFAAHSPFGGATWFYPDPSASGQIG
jgi:hypothetical protein